MVRLLAPFVSAGGRILDVGGGTGHLAALVAAATGCEVTVLDRSRRMLDATSAPLGVLRVHGDAAALPFEYASFDAAIVVDALHHMDRQRDVAFELARVIRPGGGVLVADEDSAAWAVKSVAILERLIGEPGAFMTPEAVTALFSQAGFDGTAEPQGSSSYVFIGERAGGAGDGGTANKRIEQNARR
jgi:ubiquinone/menaquinone biosynthesis C-methylase UbiE